MAGYPRLSWTANQLRIGRVKKLRNAGLSPDEIATKMNRPIEEIQEYLLIIAETDANNPNKKG